MPVPATLLRATSDEQFITAWLSRPGLSPRTIRSCGKEAWRFLAWCRWRNQALADIRFEDLAAYSAFLVNPQPAEQWVQTTRWRRDDPRWRPFAGALSAASHRQAMVILRSMFRWAEAAHYLAANPGALLGKLSLPIEETVSRFLSPASITLLLDAVEHLPVNTLGQRHRQVRARFLVQMFYMTASRLSEVADANMGSIRPDHSGNWWLHLVGKGSKTGQVPAQPELVDAFRCYRQAIGLAAHPSPRDPMPLILATTGTPRRATHHAIAKVMTGLMARASELASSQGDLEAADRLSQASTHWLRHSSLTHQVDAGVPLKSVQQNARHATLATTGRYVHKEKSVRHAETSAALTLKPR